MSSPFIPFPRVPEAVPLPSFLVPPFFLGIIFSSPLRFSKSNGKTFSKFSGFLSRKIRLLCFIFLPFLFDFLNGVGFPLLRLAIVFLFCFGASSCCNKFFDRKYTGIFSKFSGLRSRNSRLRCFLWR